MLVQAESVEEREEAMHGTTHRRGAREAGQAFHRGVPLQNGERKIGDDQRIVECLQDAGERDAGRRPC